MTDLPILRRADDGYEQARQAAIWNGKKPDRFPDAIVVARDEADVVAAVRLANAEGWTIGIRSGGHAWSATGVRDGGLLLDLSSLDRWEIDPAARTVAVGPGRPQSGVLAGARRARPLLPTGTCSTVGIGGYTIGGGASFTGMHGRTGLLPPDGDRRGHRRGRADPRRRRVAP